MDSAYTPLYFIVLLAIFCGVLAVYCKQGEVKFTKRAVVLMGAGVVIILAAWFYLHPGWQSPSNIRASLLRLTPPGSSMSQVLSLAQRKGWVQNPSISTPGTLSGCLRRDPFPYRTSVSVTWIFNASNQLADISVFRYE